MSNVILASGPIGSDRLTIELLQPSDSPKVILINWPPASTVTTPQRFDATVAAAMHVLVAARVALAQLKAAER